VEWPGFRTTANHSMGETQSTTKNWMGSLLEGQRDAGGQMYMRNRYYDPATGQFTQSDPIGIAGGLNTYGFAAGDPISYSDPYGLRVEFDKNTEEAGKRLWDALAHRANSAMRSDDPEIRAAGRQLANMMFEMWNDDERVYTIRINNDPRWVGDNGGGLETADGPNRRLVQVTDQPSLYTSMSPWMALAHELGGAQSSVRDGSHDRPSVRAENAARTIVGCKLRNWNHNFDQWNWLPFGIMANPTCKR
jgi:RHS repeat-associated protein